MASGRLSVANARMYSVSPEAGAAWHALLSAIIAASGLPIEVIEHPAPAPLEDLWLRTDQAAVFMCGLPFSRAHPAPVLVAAPVPSPADFGGEPRYWSELVVRADSHAETVTDTFGSRIAFTVPTSQSGCVAALTHLMILHGSLPARPAPLFAEVVAPTITPVGALCAVVQGTADVAPIDSYALRLLAKYRPDLTSQVRVVGRTAPTPIPPLVASSTGTLKLTEAFLAAGSSAGTRELLGELLLSRFAKPDPGSYAVLSRGFDAAAAYWRSRRLAERIHPAFAL